MFKKISPKKTVLLIASVLVLLGVSLSTYADLRSSRERFTSETLINLPIPSPIKPPVINNGGINSSTSGNVNTGGNSGGNVVTGDESLEVHEVNIGPTNPPTVEPDNNEGGPESGDDQTNCNGDLRSSRDCDGAERSGGR